MDPRLRFRPRWLALVAATTLFTGCGTNDQGPLPASTVITAPPIPVGTLVAGCSAAELEAWYEVASTLSDSFAAESVAALDLPSDTLLDTLTRQNDLLDRILREPVPECAGAAQAEIVKRLRAINAAFTSFYDTRITADELRARVTAEAQAMETEVGGVLDGIASGLEALYALEAQTPTPAR